MVVPDLARLAETLRDVVSQHGDRGKVRPFIVPFPCMQWSKVLLRTQSPPHRQLSGNHDAVVTLLSSSAALLPSGDPTKIVIESQ